MTTENPSWQGNITPMYLSQAWEFLEYRGVFYLNLSSNLTDAICPRTMLRSNEPTERAQNLATIQELMEELYIRYTPVRLQNQPPQPQQPIIFIYESGTRWDAGILIMDRRGLFHFPTEPETASSQLEIAIDKWIASEHLPTPEWEAKLTDSKMETNTQFSERIAHYRDIAQRASSIAAASAAANRALPVRDIQ